MFFSLSTSFLLCKKKFRKRTNSPLPLLAENIDLRQSESGNVEIVADNELKLHIYIYIYTSR